MDGLPFNEDTRLAFWLWPDWAGGSLDHPGDPRFSPFWDRPIKRPTAPVPVLQTNCKVYPSLGTYPYPSLGTYEGIPIIGGVKDPATDEWVLSLAGGRYVRVDAMTFLYSRRMARGVVCQTNP